MGFLDLKGKTNTNQNDSSAQNTESLIREAELNLGKAAEDTRAAIYELGQKYFEANRDKGDSEYKDCIGKIESLLEKEELWKLYRLDIEGKTKCDSCGAIITSDSAFCNKCGKPIAARDFSILGINKTDQVEKQEESSVCPSCGASLVDGAMFCEKCGTKIR